ncbi:MAG: RidA family protein [Acidimicrobiales bacterium]
MQCRSINPWTWQEEYGFHQGREVVGAERTLYLSGQVSLDADGRVTHPDDMGAQISQCIENVAAVLAEANMALANVVRFDMFTTDIDLFLENAGALQVLNEAGCEYASTLVEVSRLAFPEFLVELKATAVA